MTAFLLDKIATFLFRYYDKLDVSKHWEHMITLLASMFIGNINENQFHRTNILSRHRLENQSIRIITMSGQICYSNRYLNIV